MTGENFILTFPVLILDKEKINLKFLIFTLFYGASKGFMKVLKAFCGTTKKCENKNLS